jgi:hypothetical protein
MNEALSGCFQIVDVRALHRKYLGACIFMLFTGLFFGAYTAHSVFASGPNAVAKGLVDVGGYLCKQWDGLAEIARVDQTHYAFRCNTLATFPQVQITMKGDPGYEQIP